MRSRRGRSDWQYSPPIACAARPSTWTRWPLVRTFLFNEQVMRVDVVHEALRQHGTERQFERRLQVASWMVAGSFFLSSVLNYGLARYLLVSPPGTPAFTEELGKMTALSFPVIALPSTVVLVAALFYLLQGVQKLTHLQLEDLFGFTPFALIGGVVLIGGVAPALLSWRRRRAQAAAAQAFVRAVFDA